jgi:hypothetical protein
VKDLQSGRALKCGKRHFLIRVEMWKFVADFQTTFDSVQAGSAYSPY